MKRFVTLTDEDIQKVIAYIPSYHCTPERIPLLVALYTLMANLGLRVSEALDIRWRDCDFEREEITIRTLKQHRKTREGKPELVEDTLPLNAVTITTLQAIKNGAAPHALIFPRLTRRVAYNIFQRLLHYAGIPPVKLHALRHSAVTRWVATGDLAFAMTMARHRDLKTTSRYTHCAKLREQFLSLKAVGGILLSLCVLWSSAEAADWTWRTADTVREATWVTLHVVDWGQTLDIARQPERFHERNPFLGKHPSVGEVNAYASVWLLLHPTISFVLPPPYRDVWQYVSIGVTGSAVVMNFAVGLRVRF